MIPWWWIRRIYTYVYFAINIWFINILFIQQENNLKHYICVSAGLILALTSFLPVEDQGGGRGMTMSKHIG